MSLFQRIRTPFGEAGEDQSAQGWPRRHAVGTLLRERREELELDLEAIGEALRIKPAFLAALEQGRAQDLPGATYAVGFIRAYAHYLGFDADRVLDSYKAESAEVQARPDLALPLALGERSLPGGPILLVGLILALCGYGTWYYWSASDQTRPERVTAVPASLQQQAAPSNGGTAAKPAGSAAPSAPAPGASSSGGPRLSSGLLQAPTAPQAAVAATTPPPVSAPPGPGLVGPAAAALPPAVPAAPAAPETAPAAPDTVEAAAPAGPGAGKVDIRAVADCWIQVRGADQAIVFSKVLKAGETYHVPARQGLLLRTGNAGALAITVDGKPAPSIGAIGTLRRNVRLEGEALLAGTAVGD